MSQTVVCILWRQFDDSCNLSKPVLNNTQGEMFTHVSRDKSQGWELLT